MKNKKKPDTTGEAVSDYPQPITKREVLALIEQKKNDLQQEEAHWDAKETARLLQQQSYQLDDFLDPDEIGIEEVDFDPLIKESTRTAQIAHTLAVLGKLEQTIRNL